MKKELTIIGVLNMIIITKFLISFAFKYEINNKNEKFNIINSSYFNN